VNRLGRPPQRSAGWNGKTISLSRSLRKKAGVPKRSGFFIFDIPQAPSFRALGSGLAERARKTCKIAPVIIASAAGIH